MIAIRNSHPTIQIIYFHAVHDSHDKPANLFTDTVKSQNSDGFVNVHDACDAPINKNYFSREGAKNTSFRVFRVFCSLKLWLFDDYGY